MHPLDSIKSSCRLMFWSEVSVYFVRNEVLVGKTLEQSMMEVLEEEELASLQRPTQSLSKLLSGVS